MELEVVETKNLPPDSVLHIRAGAQKRQLRLPADAPLGFSTLPANAAPVRVEAFERLCGKPLAWSPDAERYICRLPAVGEGAEALTPTRLELAVGEARPAAAGALARRPTFEERKAVRTEQARRFLTEREVLQPMQEMLAAALQDLPSEPFAYMAAFARRRGHQKAPAVDVAALVAAEVAARDVPSGASDAAGISLRHIFEMCDTDHNGGISKIELIKAVRRDPAVAKFFGLQSCIRQEDGSRAEMERVFQSLDVNGDRLISWSEFSAWFAMLQKASPAVGSTAALPPVAEAVADAPVVPALGDGTAIQSGSPAMQELKSRLCQALEGWLLADDGEASEDLVQPLVSVRTRVRESLVQATENGLLGEVVRDVAAAAEPGVAASPAAPKAQEVAAFAAALEAGAVLQAEALLGARGRAATPGAEDATPRASAAGELVGAMVGSMVNRAVGELSPLAAQATSAADGRALSPVAAVQRSTTASPMEWMVSLASDQALASSDVCQELGGIVTRGLLAGAEAADAAERGVAEASAMVSEGAAASRLAPSSRPDSRLDRGSAASSALLLSDASAGAESDLARLVSSCAVEGGLNSIGAPQASAAAGGEPPEPDPEGAGW